MIVQLAAEGALVQEADDYGSLHLRTDLDADGVRTALRTTGTGELVDDGSAWLDLGVLRANAQLAATSPDWAQRWAEMIAEAERKGLLSEDGRAVRVAIER
ncbi:hypothetical protein [Pseudonocardia nigra]|uniref:hypothetical protein n=1 Tax=Pseudonocardia nigra TaxID=1921578 RepID=UPI001C5D1B6B|nr:hypothetical protein [Pseudonocardia nigra]